LFKKIFYRDKKLRQGPANCNEELNLGLQQPKKYFLSRENSTIELDATIHRGRVIVILELRMQNSAVLNERHV
jgi:hypothetical protein